MRLELKPLSNLLIIVTNTDRILVHHNNYNYLKRKVIQKECPNSNLLYRHNPQIAYERYIYQKNIILGN